MANRFNVNPHFAAIKFMVFVGWVAITIALTFMAATNKGFMKTFNGIGQQWWILVVVATLITFVVAWVMEHPGKKSVVAGIVLLIIGLIAIIANWSGVLAWAIQSGWILLSTLAYVTITGGIALFVAKTPPTIIQPNQP